MDYSQLLQQAQDYVTAYYRAHTNETLFYHSPKHTEDVVASATQIANHYQLSDRDFCVVLTATWFHDLGYFEDAENHEAKGAELLEKFLKEHDADDEFIIAAKACIMATKMPQAPDGLLAQIICDADLFHLGLDDFGKKDKQIRKEINARYNQDLTKQQWRIKTLAFLEAHHYHTEYAKVLLNDGKAKNRTELKEKIAKNEQKEVEEMEDSQPLLQTLTEPGSKSDKKAKKKDRPEKGIETMFRISSSNHQRLSTMADNKAHIMITVNSIILSAIISLILRKISEYEFLLIPTFILLSVCVLAITFAILSTRPSIPAGVFTRKQVDDKMVNLLFFGNFYKMPFEEYAYGMTRMMESNDFLYGSLIRDLYSQGVILGRKYKLLRISYNIFMFGLIIAVAAFIIASLFVTRDPHPHFAPAN